VAVSALIGTEFFICATVQRFAAVNTITVHV
jgi:hypothetical protein